MAGMNGKKTSAGKKKMEEMKAGVKATYKEATSKTPALGKEAMKKKKAK